MRLFSFAVVVAIATALAVPAAAQGTGSSSSTQKPSTSKKPPAPKLPIGYRAFVVVDAESMAASKSFDGVTGSPIVIGYGGGAQILNIWKKVFVRGSVAMASTSGERGFAVNGTFLSTGIPVDISMRTVEIGTGWRSPMKKHQKVALYFGGGLLFMNYSDESPFAGPGDNVKESFRGYAGEAGVEMGASSRMALLIEGQYRTIPTTPASQSIQASFNETDLGGFALRVMISLRLGKK